MMVPFYPSLLLAHLEFPDCVTVDIQYFWRYLLILFDGIGQLVEYPCYFLCTIIHKCRIARFDGYLNSHDVPFYLITLTPSIGVVNGKCYIFSIILHHRATANRLYVGYVVFLPVAD